MILQTLLRATSRDTLRNFAILLVSFFAMSGAWAEVVKVYGAGDSSPPYKDAAAIFEKQTGHKVIFVVGPAAIWLNEARQDADFIFGGSHSMLSQLAVQMGEQLPLADVHTLYLRKTVILVRRGNPKHIQGFVSLMQADLKVLVGNAPGIYAVWEDMAGKTADIQMHKTLRRNIVNFAGNNMDAIKYWTEHPEVDAWILWNVLSQAHPELGEAIAVEAPYTTYRVTAAVVTKRGRAKPAAEQFLTFLESAEGAQIFAQRGWLTESAR